jgi:putative ABC transport system permease protein
MSGLRPAFRVLFRSPGFSAIALLAFALGIGANSAIFSVVNAVLLRPLAYHEPERLVVLEHAGPSPVAPGTFLDWRAQASSFERMGAAQAWGGSLRTAERPESVAGLRVTADLFSLLGVPPLLGRTFAAGEDRDGAAPVVVLSYALWQRSFGGARDVVGRRVEIDGAPWTVAGVMPASFQFAPFWVTKAEMWAPLPLETRRLDRTGRSLRVFARLKAGVGIGRAQAELSSIMERLARQYPESNAKEIVSLTPLQDRVVRGVRPMLFVLLGTVGFVLLIACANVANLMLARAAGRQRDTAVRIALGASRWQLARQAIAESAVLAMLGGVLGLALASTAVPAINAALPAGTLPRQAEVAVDWQMFAYSGVLALLTGVLAGLFPAWHSWRGAVSETLKRKGQTQGTRNVLVIAEVALAFVLLTGAGLMVRSFAALLSQDGGFDPANLLTLEVSVSGTRQADPARRLIFYREVLERIAALPGVRGAGAVNHTPITGDVWGTRYRVEGQPEPLAGEWPGAVYRVSMPGYFAVMRTPLLRGRDFGTHDTLQSPRVAIVNETLARKQWPEGDAIGKRIATGRDSAWFTVVGIVRDVKQSDWQSNPREEIYFPFAQSPEYLANGGRHYASMNLVIRVDSDPAGKSAAVRQAIESVDAGVLVSNLIAMEQAVEINLWRPRVSLLLLGTFAVVALVLAVTGIYGVISHTVSRRTQEIGIRLAIGAPRSTVLAGSIGQSLPPLLAGIAAGLALSLLLTRLMATMLFGVTATDPATLAAAAGAMLAAGVFAAFWPALRAARTDPMIALRHN